MTLQVNIGEAKDSLSQLVAAAMRGEDVVIARSGQPKVRLVPVDADSARAAEQTRRASAFGMFRDTANWDAIDRAMAPMSDDELDEWTRAPSSRD